MSGLADYRDRLVGALTAVDLAEVERFIEALAQVRSAGRTVFTCGNGGSAATASHFATDLGKGASYGQPSRFKVIALTDSVPTITAYANDVDYAVVFAEPLINHAQAGDMLVAISGSGNSENVIRATQAARDLGVLTVGMTGFDGGRLGPLLDIHINVPDEHMGRIEDAHMALCHMSAFQFIDQHTQH